jgi:hypothetical protein
MAALLRLMEVGVYEVYQTPVEHVEQVSVSTDAKYVSGHGGLFGKYSTE